MTICFDASQDFIQTPKGGSVCVCVCVWGGGDPPVPYTHGLHL